MGRTELVEKDEVDVACIGGGPASAFAAIEILKAGKLVEIFEEHGEIGRPVSCAGLISLNGFNKLKIKVPNDCIQNRVRGSIFFSPSGYQFEVKRKETQAYVIDRAKFDKYLIDIVEKFNGIVHLNAKVISLIKEKSQYVGITIQERQMLRNISSKLIIDGEGVRAKFVESAGLKASRYENLIPAIQYEMRNVQIDKDFVEIYLGRKIAPGFFAYIIPTSEDTVRVAVGSRVGKPQKYIQYFIKKHPIASRKLKKGIIYKRGGGLIIIGGPVKKTYAPGFLGIGDAVGQVKATTGGGVVFGGLCAKIAGRIAVEALKQDDFSANFLKKYQKEWQQQYLRDLRLMKLLRSLLNAMPDKILDELFLTLSDQKIPKLIEDIGDMDMQGPLIRKVLFSPWILKIIVSLLWGILKR
ncbi:MAG: geranylgeranyl reductase family protein [Candidatus Helarchaeota archaeon]